MTSLKEEMVLSGAVDKDMVAELQSFAAPLDELLDIEWDTKPKTAEEALTRIQEAIMSRDQVEIRATDLNIMRRYLENQEEGKLHLTDSKTGQKTSFKVIFAWSEMKEIILPWRSDNIEDLLIDPDSFLRTGGKKLYFGTVQELYFGKQKTFLLCTIAEVESKDD